MAGCLEDLNLIVLREVRSIKERKTDARDARGAPDGGTASVIFTVIANVIIIAIATRPLADTAQMN